MLRAYLLAAFRDVAHADAGLAVQQARTSLGIERVQLEAGDPNHVARPVVEGLVVVVAQDVADVLAKKAFDALAVLVDAFGVFRQHPVGDRLVRPRGETRDLLVDLVVP